MNKYDLIFEAVQESLNNGEITLEEAELLNDYAYDKYVEEATRLAKEIHKLNKSTDARSASNRYERMLKNANRDVETGSDEYGRFGYIFTDSLDHGRGDVAKAIKKYGKGAAAGIYTDIARDTKSKQKKVFNTEPADSSYYDAKRKASQRREILNDVGLQRGRALIKDQADKYKKQLDSTKNPLKKAMYNIDNKKAREAIAKEYITNKKETDREANDKLKEILKNRK